MSFFKVYKRLGCPPSLLFHSPADRKQFNDLLAEKVKILTIIRERNIIVRQFREMVKRANDRDFRQAQHLDERLRRGGEECKN